MRFLLILLCFSFQVVLADVAYDNSVQNAALFLFLAAGQLAKNQGISYAGYNSADTNLESLDKNLQNNNIAVEHLGHYVFWDDPEIASAITCDCDSEHSFDIDSNVSSPELSEFPSLPSMNTLSSIPEDNRETSENLELEFIAEAKQSIEKLVLLLFLKKTREQIMSSTLESSEIVISHEKLKAGFYGFSEKFQTKLVNQYNIVFENND